METTAGQALEPPGDSCSLAYEDQAQGREASFTSPVDGPSSNLPVIGEGRSSALLVSENAPGCEDFPYATKEASSVFPNDIVSKHTRSI